MPLTMNGVDPRLGNESHAKAAKDAEEKPNGLPSFSPRLRGTRYLGKRVRRETTLKGLRSRRATTLSGLLGSMPMTQGSAGRATLG